MDPGGRSRPTPRARSMTSRVLAPNRKEKRPRILPSIEDEAERPGGEVGVAFQAVGDRVHIGLERHGEGDDVHRQDAHHGDAADDVERGDARRRRGRRARPLPRVSRRRVRRCSFGLPLPNSFRARRIVDRRFSRKSRKLKPRSQTLRPAVDRVWLRGPAAGRSRGPRATGVRFAAHLARRRKVPMFALAMVGCVFASMPGPQAHRAAREACRALAAGGTHEPAASASTKRAASRVSSRRQPSETGTKPGGASVSAGRGSGGSGHVGGRRE